MDLKSPVTYSNNISFIRNFETGKIIRKYADDGKLDVTRFLNRQETIQLYQCNDTGYRFYYPFDIYGDDLFYQQLSALHAWYYPAKKWEHKQALRVIQPQDRVLEIGAGDGFFMKLCKEEGIENITGLELNSAAVQKATKEGLTIYSETIQDFSKGKKEQYDAVCFFQVLEHIVDVKDFIESSLHVLKPDGRLIIAVPNNTPYLFDWDDYHTFNLPPHHSGLWNKEAFAKLETFFPLKMEQVLIEPLFEYRYWIKVQIEYTKLTKPVKAKLMKLIPKWIYKLYIKMNKEKIEGRNLLIVFKKTRK